MVLRDDRRAVLRVDRKERRVVDFGGVREKLTGPTADGPEVVTILRNNNVLAANVDDRVHFRGTGTRDGGLQRHRSAGVGGHVQS